MQTVILAIGLLIFFSYAAAGLFARTRIPDVLPLTLLGIVLGPVLGWSHPTDFGSVGAVMSLVALIVLLFEGGTSLNLSTLAWSMRSALGLSVAAYIAAAAALALLGGLFLGLRPMSAAIFGLVSGGTSSAVVIPIVRRFHIRESTKTILIMESAITDVLCIVAVFTLVFGVHAGAISPVRLAGTTIASMGMAIVIGLAGALAWLSLVGRVRQATDPTLATLALAFVLYGVTEHLGFSGGIAALAFGFGLANHLALKFDRLVPSLGAAGFEPITAHEKVSYQEAVFLLKTFFFVYLGVSMHLPKPGDWVAILLVLAVYVSRALVTRFTVARSLDLQDAAITSVMAPKGLAAAVLASVPLQAGIAGGEIIRDQTYLVVLVSILLTATMVPLIDRGALKGLFRVVLGPKQTTSSQGSVPAG